MPRLLSLLSRFRSDESGAFLVIFGVLAIVLVAAAGAVVDFTTIEQARARAQDSLDSAALGLQPSIFDDNMTEEQLRAQAQNLLVERLTGQNVTATVNTASMNVSDGTLRLNASIVVPTAFVSLIGYPDVTANLVSEATRKRLNVEVAMVLDNSGSMSNQSRMTNLKAAANCATNILLNGDCNSAAATADQTTVKIGIVPFTELVNVGTGFANASWMDTTGASSIANDNFDDDERDDTVYTGTVNRWTLYNQLSNVSWQGCVEARPYPYDTNDVTPDPLTPDTMFVPEFAPDTPSGYDNSYLSDSHSSCRVAPTWTWVEQKTNCTSRGRSQSSYNSATCYGSTTSSVEQTDEWGIDVTPASNSAPADGSPAAYYNDGACTYRYSNRRTRRNPNRYTNTQTVTCEYDFSDREKQERLCKYHGSISTSGGRGPNWDCPTNSLLPLTNVKADVTAAISAMYPQGYTNIHQGAIWGFHMLSPTQPLTDGDDYGTATYKVMIIMTDGENTVDGYSSSDMNRADGYMAYGYPGPPTATVGDTEYNGRIFSDTYPAPSNESQVLSAMNTRTVETCNNAKAEGITIYTIGLNAPNQTTIDMLEDCASGPAYSYFPTQSSELITVFEEIASQLSTLRLAL